jgi:hypothetical protein
MRIHLATCLALALAAARIAEEGFAQEASAGLAPRTSWGAPDLQGYWTNTSLTTMERPEGADRLVVTEQEAARLGRAHVLTRAASGDARQASLADDASDRLLADQNTSRAYNQFWMDPGGSYARVKGEYRTSWITDPANGHIPWTQAGRRASMPMRAFDGPEARPQSERCLMSFTGGAGPILTNGLYNNTYQIVQTPGSVMILTEMIHDVRIISISDKHGPQAIPKWGGDSVGRYDGDTLVVETVNPHPGQRSLISSSGKLTERFTRWSDGQVLYEFMVEDPALYTSVWRGEIALNASAKPPYEYACHEGNYALTGILTGARQMERDGRPRQPIREMFPGVDVSEGQ